MTTATKPTVRVCKTCKHFSRPQRGFGTLGVCKREHWSTHVRSTCENWEEKGE